jgi:type III restriction enzyme
MLFEKQQYQTNCVNNIIKSLQHCDLQNANYINLNNNLKTLQQKNSYNYPIKNQKQIDILMETGTGKTFTYLKTIFEINKQFNHTKFIIVLPRTAIKLGVVQNINLTKEYFYNEYKKHLNYIEYPKDGVKSILQNFVNNNDLSILITTNSAITGTSKNNRNIHKKTENLFTHGSVWQAVAAKNPVVIIDEPHLLTGDETTKAFEELTNSLFIRFGATYPKNMDYELSNVVYKLDSIDAFNSYLVKQIGVNTLFADNSQSALQVHNIKAKHSFDACYNINNQLYKTKVRINTDLGAITGLTKYNGITVVKINKTKIFLSDKTTIDLYSGKYELDDNEIEQMVKKTIELHFEKEEKLFNQNIKTLSLFFIPNISDFRGDKPLVKNLFEKHYKQIRDDFYQKTTNQEYKKYLDNDFKDGKLQVAQGYFSGDKGNKDEKEAEGINTILNDKEKLLSFKTPLRFIFSVWALQEGWDNPNIFNICKLSSTSKDTSRRQQVGRGLRLAVNQDGKRITYNYLSEKESEFYEANFLDVVVSGKEQDFISGIQTEIMDSSTAILSNVITLDILKEKYINDKEASRIFIQLEDHNIIDENGKIQSNIDDFLTNNRNLFSFIDDARFAQIIKIFSNNKTLVKDKNKPKQQVNIKQEHWDKFKELWEVINKKSKIIYNDINQDNLISVVAEEFNKQKINKTKILLTKQTYNTQNNIIENNKEEILGDVNYFNDNNLTNFIAKWSEDTKYPLNFVVKLFNNINLDNFYNSPKYASDLLKQILKQTIHANIIKSVNYGFSETNIYPNELQDKKGKVLKNIDYTKLGIYLSDAEPQQNFLYDKVVYDSNIEKDSILDDPQEINNNKITVFAKLPKINIPIPMGGTYNPDFAYLLEKKDGKMLFLIVETKGYKYQQDIAGSEQNKINYAKKFFAKLQQELPSIEIKYHTRLNGQTLAEVLSSNEK